MSIPQTPNEALALIVERSPLHPKREEMQTLSFFPDELDALRGIISRMPSPERMPTVAIPEAGTLEVWGYPGEIDLAVGPKAGGVAACQIATTTGDGRFNVESAARGVMLARLFAAAPDLFHALNSLQANPNDPRAHRLAMNALKVATATGNNPAHS